MRFFRKLSVQLVLLVIFILTPLIVLQLYQITEDYQNHVNEKLDSSEKLANVLSISFMNYVEKIWHGQGVIGNTILSSADWSEGDISRFLNDVLVDQTTIKGYSWITPSGKVIASTDTVLKGLTLKRDYIKRINDGEERIISPIVKSEVDGNWILPIATGVRKDGHLIGIVTTAVDVSKMDLFLPDIGFDETGSYGLIDSKGQLVFSSGKEVLPYNLRYIPKNSPAWSALKGNIVKSYVKKSNFDNTLRIGVDYPISEIGWVCYVSSSQTQILSKYKKEMTTDILILFFLTGGSILAAIFLGKRIMKPVLSIRNVSKQIESGNFSARTNIKGSGESETIAQVFDRMADSIQTKLNNSESLFSVGELAASIAHEVRNPMTTVRGFVQILQNQNEAGQKEHYQLIISELDRANSIITNFLSLASTKGKDAVSSINLNHIVQEIKPLIEAAGAIKGISIHISLDSSVTNLILNRDEIKQVLINLTRNAIEAIEKNGDIKIITYVEESGDICLLIADTGIGIPKKEIDYLFSSFYTTKASGTGLGLPISKSIIEKHNGSISVQSEVGVGTTFIICFKKT